MSGWGTISRRGLLRSMAALGAAGVAARAAAVRAATPAPAGQRAPQAQPAGQIPGRGEFVVRGAYVLTVDPALGDFEQGDVHVRNGEIVAVGASVAAPGAEVLDGRDMIALPGLIDTHWHLWNSQLRNLVDEGPELGYFAWAMRLGVAYRPDDTYRGVRLGATEAILSGVTTVHDWAHNVRSPADADADLQALADTGIRARFSYGTPHGLDPDLPMDRADLARVQREWIGPRTEGLLTLGMASRGRSELTRLHTARPDILRADWAYARSRRRRLTAEWMFRPSPGLARAMYLRDSSEECREHHNRTHHLGCPRSA
ncbi:MAG TPA: amidohydrolase family protein [Chloroflexota bacterium]|nr:amidohydrolase family protein [Chloroflexota bacterium]